MEPEVSKDTGYLSVEREATTELVIKRSRFIGYVSPVQSVSEAEAMIARLREQYPDASHVCYAYRIGLETTTTKMSDDGEPKGTAGRPILEVLERRQIENVCVAVVRYFGGTLLGAAGLTRAYAQTAAAVVDEAVIVQYVLHMRVDFLVSYGDWSKVEHMLTTWGIEVTEVAYLEQVKVQVMVPLEEADTFIANLTDLTAGEVTVTRGETGFRPNTRSRPSV